jgi:BASS family bile acid:Na+ symporter
MARYQLRTTLIRHEAATCIRNRDDMTLQQLIMIALQVSVIAMVFGFGLKATPYDLTFLIRHPGILGRSLLAMFILMPLLAVALASAFHLTPAVKIALVTLSIAPLPPLLPKKLGKAGGHASYSIALMATVALLAVVIVPLAVELLERYLGQAFAMAPSAVAGIVLKSALLPLSAGMALRALFPATADRIEGPISLIGNILLPLAVLVLVGGSLDSVWAAVGNGTVVAIACFVVTGLAIGHLLGGPDPDQRVVLGLSTACRHPAIALAIAAANFPEERFGATILLYLLINAIIDIPYTIWLRPKSAKPMLA